MESASSTKFSFPLRHSCSPSSSSPATTKLRETVASTTANGGSTFSSRRSRRAFVRVSASFSYDKFVQFAVAETKLHTHLSPAPLQEKFSRLKALDGETDLQLLSYKASKIRHLRSLRIQGSDGMQVLDFAIFPEPEYDLPIFCANFFTASKTNIVVLDLNPLYDVTKHKDYKEKYYKSLLPLGLKYAEVSTRFYRGVEN